MILAGDVGGTNSRFAAFEEQRGKLVARWSRTWPSREAKDLVELVRRAKEECGVAIDRASFGVAGPVREGRVQATNLPWIVDAKELARALAIERVDLLNDLEANAWGLDELAGDDLLVIQRGAPNARGNRALIAAGTGLGEAGLYFDGRAHRPFACEGGHASFAPDDELEDELLRHLRKRFGHVSWERVLSGPGLHNVYLFLRDTGRAEEPASLARAMASGDPSAEISKAALAGDCPIAERTLELFVKLYGSEAGNLALKIMATGGLYVGGGIAPKIAKWMARPTFLEEFRDKGRMRAVLEAMPVYVVLNDQTALLGAARHAASGGHGG